MQKNIPSAAGQFLKSYRERHNLTQEQFASEILMEPRTLRAYENGERQLTNINELRRIADFLGVEPEKLGVTSLYIPKTPEEIEKIIEHAWKLVEESRLTEARSIIERLVQNIKAQITSEDPKLLESLAHVYHSAGYIVSEATHAKESFEAILYYQQLENIARIIKDDTSLNIALTYQGDMYRRLGNLEKATVYLEAARNTTPKADEAAKGNGIQLLARVYFRKNEIEKFEHTMSEAEEISYTFDPNNSSTRGHYNPGTVYEDWGRSYADMGKTQQAMDYLERAEANLPKTKFWQLLMMTSKAIALIKGNNIKEGIQLAIKVTEESKDAGILRYIDRIKTIDRYLQEKEAYISKARKPLKDVLYGGDNLDY